MTTMQTTAPATPGILSGAPRRVRTTMDDAPRSSRFVTQSHALSAPITSPGALIIAATVAVAIYLIGRRLSD